MPDGVEFRQQYHKRRLWAATLLLAASATVMAVHKYAKLLFKLLYGNGKW